MWAGFLRKLEPVLERLDKVGLYAAVHKCIFSTGQPNGVGECVQEEWFKYDRERLIGLASIRHPISAGGFGKSLSFSSCSSSHTRQETRIELGACLLVKTSFRRLRRLS